MAHESALARATRHPQVCAILNRFLDLLDQRGFEGRNRRLVELLPSDYLPHLNGNGRPGDDQNLWCLITSLEKVGILKIAHRRKRRVGQDPWEHAEIEFLPAGEQLVRETLGRPQRTRWGKSWREAVEARAEAFADPEYAARQPLRPLHGLSAEQMVERLVRLPTLLRARPRSVYQIAARLFDGDSKALLNREAWLLRTFGLDTEQIIERPMVVELCLPSGSLNGVLLIENLDSYLEATSGSWPRVDGLALVYTAGFRGTAVRVRNPAHACFHLSVRGDLERDRLRVFARDWCAKTEMPWPVYFFGDLDWAGLAIFRELRGSFPGLRPWHAGYQALLRAQEDGLAHDPDVADKANQSPVLATGDDWLDTVAQRLKAQPRFVDQELASEYLEPD